MELNTKLFGTIEYARESIISFDEGLIGISDKKDFILIEKEDFFPFNYLQSVEDPSFTLVIISPFFVEKEYKFDIHKDDLSTIDVAEAKDFIISAIVVFSDKVEDITVNLKAPLIINIESKKGKQILLQNNDYGVTEPLVKASTLDKMETEDKDKE